MSAVPSQEALAPPSERLSALRWLRKNLFSTWYNALLTVLALGLLIAILRPLATWLFSEAQWQVVAANQRLFMVGLYPADQLWRVWLCLILLGVIIGVSWGIWAGSRRIAGLLVATVPFALAAVSGPDSRLYLAATGVAGIAGYAVGRLRPDLLRRPAVAGWALFFALAVLLIRGLEAGPLPVVQSALWGGLLLTLLLTVVGIVLSFPLGVLLALGRRSGLPIVRAVCVVYIELVRGVPLVTILFMAQLVLPLFLPEGITIDRVIRAMAGIVLFSAAYLAENVRGGLQAIPRGQTEAARALGFNPFHTTFLIVLPQALRLVIPILVGQFIALFKDTSLVVIVGLLDLTGIAKTVLAQPAFIGRQTEVYLFVGAVYWVLSYVMSAMSQRLEERLGVGQR